MPDLSIPPYQWHPVDAPATTADAATYHRQRTTAAIKAHKVPCGRLALTDPTEPVLLLYFDVETTGLDIQVEAITQCSVECVLATVGRGSDGPPVVSQSLARHTAYVHTTRPVSAKITAITGITQADVAGAPPFAQTHGLLAATVESLCARHGVTHCIWVAHNGFRFDAPLWTRYLQQAEVRGDGAHSLRSGATRQFWYADTYVLSNWHMDYPALCDGRQPDNNRLGTLAAFWGVDTSVTGPLHRADADVAAMRGVFEAMLACPGSGGAALLFGHLAHDAYFGDALNTSKVAKRVRFDALVGVHGRRLRWTPQQQAVLGAPLDAHACVVAGAGCAKTTTLLGRILVLLREGVPAHRIVLTTFSRDATDDMLARLAQWVGAEVPIVANTIDGLARHYLKQYAPARFDACEHVSEYKGALLEFLRTDGGPHRAHVLGSVDHLLVDEYQDINDTYYGILEAFVQHGARLTVVGDDAQSIYGWNGAELQHLLEFGAHLDATGSTYPHRTYYLTQNFRSTPEILQVANQSIARNTAQLAKTIDATLPSLGCRPEVRRYATWAQEAGALVPDLHACLLRNETVAVLCRNCTDHGPLYHYEAVCKRHQVPCTLLERYHDRRATVDANALTLCTIHKSKGLEWDHVVVVGCTDRYFPSLARVADDAVEAQLQEERRLFYVATTRAKKRLVYAFTDGGHGVGTGTGGAGAGTGAAPMTRFLSELPRSLFDWRGGITAVHHAAALGGGRLRSAWGSGDTGEAAPARSLSRTLDGLTTVQWVQLRRRVEAVVRGAVPGVRSLQDLVTTETAHYEQQAPAWVADAHMHADVARWYLHVLARVVDVPAHPLLERVLRRVALTRREYAAWTAAQSDGGGDPTLLAKVAAKCDRRAAELAPRLGTPIAVADLHPSPRTDVPHDVRLRLQAAWTRYADRDAPWDALLWPAFEVSWCAALERGRARSLYQQLDEGQAWVQSLALPVTASVAALRLPLLDGHRAALHVPVERAGYADDLPLVLTAAAEGGVTLLDVRLVDEWTSNDTVAQLVRMAHARVAADDEDVEGADGVRVANWRRACVYSPWSGTLRTTAVDALPAETWGAVWDVFVQVVGCEADSDGRAGAGGGGGEDDVAMADASEPPVFTVQTPAWEATVAAAEREAEGV